MNLRRVSLCFLLAACGSEAAEPEPEAPAPRVSAAETEHDEPMEAAEADEAPEALDTPAAQRAALASAREAAEDENYEVALETFSALLI